MGSGGRAVAILVGSTPQADAQLPAGRGADRTAGVLPAARQPARDARACRAAGAARAGARGRRRAARAHRRGAGRAGDELRARAPGPGHRHRCRRSRARRLGGRIAATWALIAQVPTQVLALSPVAQAMMFVVPVIGYILKDRIKELTKEWMIRRMRAYDQETELVGSQLARSDLGSLCGTLREDVRFLDQAPSVVLALRQRGRWVAGARIGGEV